METIDIKKVAQIALRNEYGFAPPLSAIDIAKITLEEDRPTFIEFSVNGNRYQFKSYVSHFGDMPTVWCGRGTITRK